MKQIEVDILLEQYGEEISETFNFYEGENYLELAKKITEDQNNKARDSSEIKKVIRVIMIRDLNIQDKIFTHQDLIQRQSKIRLNDVLY